MTQGSVVVLASADASILAEAGGRRLYNLRHNRYSDYNRVTGSLRQPGSVMKPLVYLAAFRNGLTLDATVPDEPISVPLGSPADGVKWIANYDDTFKGPIPARQALAESRNAAAVWIAAAVGMEKVIRTCRDLGFRTPLGPYISTALGASEVTLLELAGAFPIPVMGKTGTTSEFRDVLFVASTYGPQGTTVAVRIGSDDNRTLGDKETGARTALPILREIMLRFHELRGGPTRPDGGRGRSRWPEARALQPAAGESDHRRC